MQVQADVVPEEGRPSDSLVVFVPEDAAAIGDYFLFRHRTSSQPVTFDEDAVVVTEKLCERQGWKVGDTITLEEWGWQPSPADHYGHLRKLCIPLYLSLPQDL